MTARSCACPRDAENALATPDRRHAEGCPLRGRRSGPPASYATRKERGYSEGNPKARLPPKLAEEAARWARGGRADEAADVLKKERKKKEQAGDVF